eukprot:CAMPEP_0171076360 /NCGR_PEP_ID=MMETSP0766_2-20121228/13361_1 /TAXON_ID=439317 /ORGANISM="Gambierdiscus australes, Strain CAWD 149" /LENGTH=223 /DNA_ID=CAMNT_0011533325 /DNA_START=74 /DNA_END=742 /DNA_ORIENTATION=-
MPESQHAIFLAAGAGAVCLLGGAGFVPGSGPLVGPRAPLPERATLQSAVSSAQGTCGRAAACAAAAASLAAAGTLVAGAAGKSRGRKASRVQAAAKVLTTDSGGRFRFVTPTVVLEPSAQPGVSAPLGFFDPLGFSKNPLMTFPNDPNGFKHLREAELKNGRFAMMATVGSVYAHYYKIPGFEDVPTGLAALGTAKGVAGFCALTCCIGLFEAANWKDKEVPG